MRYNWDSTGVTQSGPIFILDPDLNAIEGWWRRLRDRLDETAPADCESRVAFVKRLRRSVDWMDAHRRAEGRKLCRNQRVRARSVLDLRGAKCKW